MRNGVSNLFTPVRQAVISRDDSLRAVAYAKYYRPHEQFWGWKCLIGGEIIAPLLLENRQLMKAGQGTLWRLIKTRGT